MDILFVPISMAQCHCLSFPIDYDKTWVRPFRFSKFELGRVTLINFNWLVCLTRQRKDTALLPKYNSYSDVQVPQQFVLHQSAKEIPEILVQAILRMIAFSTCCISQSSTDSSNRHFPIIIFSRLILQRFGNKPYVQGVSPKLPISHLLRSILGFEIRKQVQVLVFIRMIYPIEVELYQKFYNDCYFKI